MATRVTSCPFATEVHYAYSGRVDTWAYSPVTGQAYEMSCFPGYTISLDQWPWTTSNAVRCTGGDNAVVWVW